MTALEAIQDNLSMIETAAKTWGKGNDIALIDRIRREISYLRGYEEIEAFIPMEDVEPDLGEDMIPDEVKQEQGSSQRASKFDAA